MLEVKKNLSNDALPFSYIFHHVYVIIEKNPMTYFEVFYVSQLACRINYPNTPGLLAKVLPPDNLPKANAGRVDQLPKAENDLICPDLT